MATEKRYIEANTAREELSTLSVMVTGLRAGKGVLNEYMKQYRESVLRVIDEQRTVDAVEVVHGRWELYPSSMHRRCSVCKMEYDKPRFNVRANYCPNCGARMGLEVE